jgi:hypothetical protein
MMIGSECDAVRAGAIEYLEGMIWGQLDRIEKALHPKAIQVGHLAQTYEFLSRQEFIDWLRTEKADPAGSPYTDEIISVEITGDTAIVKVTDTCFGTDSTDYLVLVKHEGVWQIVTKAFFAHPGVGVS